MRNAKKAKLRIADHDRLFDKAWVGYRPSTSTFLTDCHPQFVKTQKEAQREPNKLITVYFIRARSKIAITYSFLKIGISNNKEIRFDFDSHRFTFITLASLKCSSRTEALRIESELLKKFSSRKHIPSIKLLSGGNSECFEDAVDLESEITEAFAAYGAKIENNFGGTPRAEIDPCIHNLLLMLDCKGLGDFELERMVRMFRGNLKSLGCKVPPFDDLFKHFLKKVKNKLT